MEAGNGRKILVGMSGGVDSTVAAYLLQRSGWDVTGVTMLLWGGKKEGSSCSTSDSMKAEQAANELGIELIVKDWTHEFNETVISDFNRNIDAGKTLNPCITCNASFKVEGLVALAEEMGYEHVATGHYASMVEIEGNFYVQRGVDLHKDQSYVMHMIPEEYREKFVFPLGELNKSVIRSIASENNLTVADAPDSMGLCFSPSKVANSNPVPVDVTINGKTVSSHTDGRLLTVGQRKGINSGGFSEKMYVDDINFETKTVSLVPKSELYSDVIQFVGNPMNVEHVMIQISAHGTPVAASVQGNIIYLEAKIPKVNAGQTVVIYGTGKLDDCVLHGGTIEKFL